MLWLILLFCRFFGIFFKLFFLFSPSVVVVDFIGTMRSNYVFELFFPLSHIFNCWYKPLPLCWASVVLCNFPFFLSSFFFLFSFLILIFLKPIIIFSTFIPLFAFPTVLFPLQLIFNVCLLYLCLFNFAYIFFLSFLSSQHTCWEKEMATHSSILA